MSILFLGLDSRRRAAGFYLCLWGVGYGAFRLWLDTLHVDALRVFGVVTPDQIGAGFALALGAVGLLAVTRS